MQGIMAGEECGVLVVPDKPGPAHLMLIPGLPCHLKNLFLNWIQVSYLERKDIDL